VATALPLSGLPPSVPPPVSLSFFAPQAAAIVMTSIAASMSNSERRQADLRLLCNIL
jgi:hypothetical protein